MKKRIIALLLAISVIVSVTACGSSETSEESNAPTEEKNDSSDNIDEELETLGDIEVEKELFDVIITIPAEYMEGATQEDLDTSAAEYGYKAILNDDGTATYTMTKSQHKKFMDDYATQMNAALQELVGSETYPNFTEITANEDFTNFVVKTTSTELGLEESFSVMIFYMYGGMYGIFNGSTIDNVHVDFVNTDSGEVIESADSSEAGE